MQTNFPHNYPLIDTHCHLNLMVKKNFNTPLNEKELAAVEPIIEQAANHGVKKMITIGTNIVESNNCIAIAERYEQVFATVGIHPTDITENWKKDLATIKELVSKRHTKIVGIGETGLDFYWPGYNKQRQYDAFKAQIELALEYDLALVIHARNAYDELLYQLEPYAGQLPRGCMHCFSHADTAFAQNILSHGFVLGIGGVITYPKNDPLRTIVQDLPLDSLVLETDAPFLPPQSQRGKPNHPRSVATIAERLAVVRNQPYEQIARQTTATAEYVFRLPTSA